MNKIGTWLPVFSGFYGTFWDQDYIEPETLVIDSSAVHQDYMEWIVENVYDHIDYDQYRYDVVETCINFINGELPEGMSFEFERIVSPKEYNFTNDSVNVLLTYTPKSWDIISKYIKDNKSDFETYIKDRYTSRPGFWSNYTNDVNEWLDIVDDLKKPVDYMHEHQLGAILDFYLTSKYDDMEYIMYEQFACNGGGLSGYVNYESLISALRDGFKLSN